MSDVYDPSISVEEGYQILQPCSTRSLARLRGGFNSVSLGARKQLFAPSKMQMQMQMTRSVYVMHIMHTNTFLSLGRYLYLFQNLQCSILEAHIRFPSMSDKTSVLCLISPHSASLSYTDPFDSIPIIGTCQFPLFAPVGPLLDVSHDLITRQTDQTPRNATQAPAGIRIHIHVSSLKFAAGRVGSG